MGPKAAMGCFQPRQRTRAATYKGNVPQTTPPKLPTVPSGGPETKHYSSLLASLDANDQRDRQRSKDPRMYGVNAVGYRRARTSLGERSDLETNAAEVIDLVASIAAMWKGEETRLG